MLRRAATRLARLGSEAINSSLHDGLPSTSGAAAASDLLTDRLFSTAHCQAVTQAHRTWQGAPGSFSSLRSIHSASDDRTDSDANSSVFSSADLGTDGTSIAQASLLLDPTSHLDPSAILAAANAAEGAALAQASADAWFGSQGLQWVLNSIHEASGSGWIESIVGTSLLMRLCIMPLMIMQIKNTYGMTLAKPEIEKLTEIFKDEQARGNPQALQQHQARIMAVWGKYNCNPLKSMLPLFAQAPLFIGFFSALNALAAAKVPSMVSGGALWFTDLTVPDPLYLLPVLSSLSFLITVELGAADGMEGQADKVKKTLKNVMRGLAVVIIPLTANMPAGVFMYWMTSNTFTLFQTLLLKIPSIKKAFGLPDLRKAKEATQARSQQSLVGKPVQTFAHPIARPAVAAAIQPLPDVGPLLAQAKLSAHKPAKAGRKKK